MKLIKFAPTLMVQDMQHSIEYYRTILGFELAQSIPDSEPFDWVSMMCGEIEIALQDQTIMSFDIPEMQELKTGGTINFYVQVEDIESRSYAVACKISVGFLR